MIIQGRADKLLFQKGTVFIHLKKKGVTRNFKEYSLNALKNIHAETKKLYKHTERGLFGNMNLNEQKHFSRNRPIANHVSFGELNMVKKSNKTLFTTHSAEMGFGLTARNFTIVPESLIIIVPNPIHRQFKRSSIIRFYFHFRFGIRICHTHFN